MDLNWEKESIAEKEIELNLVHMQKLNSLSLCSPIKEGTECFCNTNQMRKSTYVHFPKDKYRLYFEQYRLIQTLCGGMGVMGVTDDMEVTDDVVVMDVTHVTDIADITDDIGVTDDVVVTDVVGVTNVMYDAGITDVAGVTDVVEVTIVVGVTDIVDITDVAGVTDISVGTVRHMA